MDKPTATPFEKEIRYPTGKKFADMTRGGKAIFVAKLVACICTFGFAFPNVQSD
jgi:hypothetical protein